MLEAEGVAAPFSAMPRRDAPMVFGNPSGMPLGLRPERAFSLAEIPQLPLEERFKSQSACRSVAYGIWVASTPSRVSC
jgi:hypothetical protein